MNCPTPLPAMSRRTVLQASTTAATFPLVAQAQSATPVASPVPGDTSAGEWRSYGQDVTGDKAILDGVVTSQNVTTLAPIWTVDVGGPVSATPVIAGGITYVGSYDGNLYAIDISSGNVVWTYETGAAVPEPNLQIPLGITGSAHVANGIVYVGDAAAMMHAVDAATGQAVWTHQVDDQENASIWSSPVVWNGMVFVGVASIAKEVGFRGSVVALNADSGDLVWQKYMVPDGADGAGVFAVPAIDEGRGVLYGGTQNAYSENDAAFGDPISIVAIDAGIGEVLWVFRAPPNDGETAPTDDVGFSASPNLFTATIDGVERDLVGEGQKSGEFWAVDRDTGQQVWNATVSPAGFLGGMEGTSAVANGVIAVPATDWPDFESPASGMVTGIDAATGQKLWSATQEAPAASPVAISIDVVFHAGFDGILHAYRLNDGEEVWTADLGASVSGGVAVANGVVIVGAATPQVAEFILPGTQIHAFGLTSDATPVASPPAAPVASPVA